MKNKIIFAIVLIIGLSVLSFAQTLTPEDAMKIRRLEAENQTLKKEKADAIESRDYWEKSSGKWKAIAQSETGRADGVQEERLKTCEDGQLILREQVADDQVEIVRLNKRVSSLKSQRNWAAVIGAGAGAAAGYYFGQSQPGSDTIINNNVPESQQKFLKPSKSFNFRIKF